MAKNFLKQFDSLGYLIERKISEPIELYDTASVQTQAPVPLSSAPRGSSLAEDDVIGLITTGAVGDYDILVGGLIKSGAIAADNLANNSITAAKIANNTITINSKLKSSSIGSDELTGSITSDMLDSPLNVTSFVANSIDADSITDNVIEVDKIKDSSIDNFSGLTMAHFSTNSVRAVNVVDGAITEAKLTDTGVSAGTYSNPTSITFDYGGRVTAITT